jgi:large subunit ribosomal protein L4
MSEKMNIKVYTVEGKEKGTIELDDRVFNVKPNKSIIYYALKAELANERQGNASTKGRSEVRGGGAKPWRQKGTGRARVGTRNSPVRVGGGITFGPKPRSYRVNLPKKMKKLSVRSVLSLKRSDELLKVVEDFSIKSGKTKDFNQVAFNITDDEKRKRVLIVDKEPKMENKQAGRNIPWLKYYDASLLNTKELYYATQVVLTESAVKLLNEKYSS